MSLPSEIEALLAEPLDAARVKQRAAGGNRPSLAYLETHDVIRTANAIFGFGKWGHEVIELRPIEAVTVHNSDKKPGTHVGYVCVVRLHVEDCIPTSGVGYGDAVEYRESAAVTAHELAAKEAESDALKRALKNYGDQFGLALYDKQAASAGHVVDQKKPAPGKSPQKSETGEHWPSKSEAEALLALVKEKGGDVQATAMAMAAAKDEKRLPKWYATTLKHWQEQPDSYANRIPDKAKAA